MDVLLIALLAVLGAAVGFLSGLFGVGGGFLLVPALITLGFAPSVAVGMSLVFMIPSAISGAISHIRQQTCDLTLASIMVPAGIVTAPLGAVIVDSLDRRFFAALSLRAVSPLSTTSSTRSTRSMSRSDNSRTKCPFTHGPAAVVFGSHFAPISPFLRRIFVLRAAKMKQVPP